MNRRDALKSLVSLPEAARVSVATLGPADTVVVEFPAMLSSRGREAIRAELAQAFPGVRCAVLECGAMVKVVKGAQ